MTSVVTIFLWSSSLVCYCVTGFLKCPLHHRSSKGHHRIWGIHEEKKNIFSRIILGHWFTGGKALGKAM